MYKVQQKVLVTVWILENNLKLFCRLLFFWKFIQFWKFADEQSLYFIVAIKRLWYKKPRFSLPNLLLAHDLWIFKLERSSLIKHFYFLASWMNFSIKEEEEGGISWFYDCSANSWDLIREQITHEIKNKVLWPPPRKSSSTPHPASQKP